MAGFKVEVEGMTTIKKNVSKTGPKYRRALAASLYEKGLAIMADAVPITPVDVNILRSSAYTAPPRGKAEDPTVEIGYGTNYAEPVHEGFARHNPPTQRKYLEDPVNSHRIGYAKWIAARIKRNVMLGVGVDTIPASMPTRPKEDGSEDQ